MLGTTHGASGAAAGLAVGLAAPSPWLGLCCGVVGYLASFTPDLDHPSSTAVRLLWLPGSLLCAALRAVSQVLTGTKHRGITHSLVFALVVAAGTWVLAVVWLSAGVAVLFGVAAFAGVVAAIAGDAVTRSGLNHVAWPFVWRLEVPRALRLRTGGVVEMWVVQPLMLALCAGGVALTLGVLR